MKRFKFDMPMVEHPEGAYVKYEEVQKLEKIIDDININCISVGLHNSRMFGLIQRLKSIQSSLIYAAPENWPLHLNRIDELIKEYEGSR